MAEDVFVNHVEEQGIIPRYGDREGALQLARTICWRYDGGASRADGMQVVTGDGMPESVAGDFNAASIVAFCPQHADQLTP